MQLEVGKKYRTRNGNAIIEIVYYDESYTMWPYIGKIISDSGSLCLSVGYDNWNVSGSYLTSGGHINDLVEEVTID